MDLLDFFLPHSVTKFNTTMVSHTFSKTFWGLHQASSRKHSHVSISSEEVSLKAVAKLCYWSILLSDNLTQKSSDTESSSYNGHLPSPACTLPSSHNYMSGTRRGLTHEQLPTIPNNCPLSSVTLFHLLSLQVHQTNLNFSKDIEGAYKIFSKNFPFLLAEMPFPVAVFA